jgi:hypothetical protein
MASQATMAPDAQGRTWITPGQYVKLRLPWSEVAMSMRVADRVMTVYLTDDQRPMAQLISDDGRAFSAPVLPSEAGIFGYPSGGFFAYQESA